MKNIFFGADYDDGLRGLDQRHRGLPIRGDAGGYAPLWNSPLPRAGESSNGTRAGLRHPGGHLVSSPCRSCSRVSTRWPLAYLEPLAWTRRISCWFHGCRSTVRSIRPCVSWPTTPIRVGTDWTMSFLFDDSQLEPRVATASATKRAPGRRNCSTCRFSSDSVSVYSRAPFLCPAEHRAEYLPWAPTTTTDTRPGSTASRSTALPSFRPRVPLVWNTNPTAARVEQWRDPDLRHHCRTSRP